MAEQAVRDHLRPDLARLRRAADEVPIARHLSLVASAADFREARERLAVAGVPAHGAAIEQALWGASSLALGSLQDRERARRAATPTTARPMGAGGSSK